MGSGTARGPVRDPWAAPGPARGISPSARSRGSRRDGDLARLRRGGPPVRVRGRRTFPPGKRGRWVPAGARAPHLEPSLRRSSPGFGGSGVAPSAGGACAQWAGEEGRARGLGAPPRCARARGRRSRSAPLRGATTPRVARTPREWPSFDGHLSLHFAEPSSSGWLPRARGSRSRLVACAVGSVAASPRAGGGRGPRAGALVRRRRAAGGASTRRPLAFRRRWPVQRPWLPVTPWPRPSSPPPPSPPS